MSRKMIFDISLLKIHIVNFLEEHKLNLNKFFDEFLFTKENMHKIAEGKFLADIPILNNQFVKVTADLSFKASPEVISKRSKLAGRLVYVEEKGSIDINLNIFAQIEENGIKIFSKSYEIAYYEMTPEKFFKHGFRPKISYNYVNKDQLIDDLGIFVEDLPEEVSSENMETIRELIMKCKELSRKNKGIESVLANNKKQIQELKTEIFTLLFKTGIEQ